MGTPSPDRRARPILWVGALVVVVALFGLAAFHNLMASAQYDLERVERELDLELERLVDLEFQVERANSPAAVERLARGVFGMTDPTDTVDMLVAPDLLAEVQISANAQSAGLETRADWAAVKPLLGAS